jgi:uncharacterized membrane protein
LFVKNKKLNIILLLSIFLIIFVFLASNINARSYSYADSYTVNYVLNKDATIDVSEELTYTFKYNLSKVELKIPSKLNISDYSGMCLDRNTCKFKFSKGLDLHSKDNKCNYLILEDNFKKDEYVKVIFNYKINTSIFKLKDGYQFYHQIYDGKFRTPNNYKIIIDIPVDFKDINYFVDSNNKDYNFTVNSNKLIFEKEYKKKDIVKINLIIPQSVNNNPVFLENAVFNLSKKNETVNSLIIDFKEVLSNRKSENTLLIFYIIFSWSPLWLFFIILFFLRKRKKHRSSGYYSSYERDLPSKHDPLYANYFVKGRFSSNWLSVVLLYLVSKRYLKIYRKNKNLFFRRTNKVFNEKDFLFQNRCFADLNKAVLRVLIRNIKQPEISLVDFNNLLTKNHILARDFYKLKVKFSNIYTQDFKDKGYLKSGNYFTLFLITFLVYPCFIILTAIIFNIYSFVSSNFLNLVSNLQGNGIYSYVFIITFCGIIYSKFSLNLFFGKWSDKGLILHLKWTNFNKYILEHSLMKEYKPSSVAIWDYYLIFALSFGSAKKCSEILFMNINSNEFEQNLISIVPYISSEKTYFLKDFNKKFVLENAFTLFKTTIDNVLNNKRRK